LTARPGSGSSGLKATDLTDGVVTKAMPKGAAATGFGGMARPSAPDLVPWLLLVAGGSLATVAGVAGLARPRRRRAPAHP